MHFLKWEFSDRRGRRRRRHRAFKARHLPSIFRRRRRGVFPRHAVLIYDCSQPATAVSWWDETLVSIFFMLCLLLSDGAVVVAAVWVWRLHYFNFSGWFSISVFLFLTFFILSRLRFVLLRERDRKDERAVHFFFCQHPCLSEESENRYESNDFSAVS